MTKKRLGDLKHPNKIFNYIAKKEYYNFKIDHDKILCGDNVIAEGELFFSFIDQTSTEDGVTHYTMWVPLDKNITFFYNRSYAYFNDIPYFPLDFSLELLDSDDLNEFDPKTFESVKIKSISRFIKILKVNRFEVRDTKVFKKFMRLYVYIMLIEYRPYISPRYSGWSFCPVAEINEPFFFGYSNVSFWVTANETLKQTFLGGESQKITKISRYPTFNDLYRKIREPIHSFRLENTELEIDKDIGARQKQMNCSLHTLIPFLKKNPTLVLGFCYNLLAFSEPVVNGLLSVGNNEKNILADGIKPFPFVLSVTGQSSSTNVCRVANLLCNMFAPAYKHIDSIDFKYAFAYNSQEKASKLTLFKHLPYIVSNMSYNINLNAASIKELLRMKNRLGVFPVFVSSNSINIHECVNIKISDINEMPQDEDSFNRIKEAFNVFYANYIDELSSIITREYKNDNFIIETTSSYDYIVTPANYPLETVRSFLRDILTDAAIDINKQGIGITFRLTLYLMHEVFRALDLPILTIDDFIAFSKKVIRDHCVSEVLKNDAKPDIRSHFIHYLLDILDGHHTPSYTFWEGRENKGKGEECFYLESNGLFEDFAAHCKTNYTKNEFNIFVKESGYFIIKDDKTSLGKYRTYKGKSLYVLILKKDSLRYGSSAKASKTATAESLDTCGLTSEKSTMRNNTEKAPDPTVRKNNIINGMHTGVDDTFKLQYFLDNKISDFDFTRKSKLEKDFIGLQDINNDIFLNGYSEKNGFGKLSDSFAYKISADLPEFNEWKQNLPSEYDYYGNMLTYFIGKNGWHTVLDLCCGAEFPLVSYLNRELNRKSEEKISITAADECEFSSSAEGITLIGKEIFEEYDFSAYDAVFAIGPKEKTESVIKACTEQNKPYFIVLDNLCYPRLNGDFAGKTDIYTSTFYAYLNRTYKSSFLLGNDSKYYAYSPETFEEFGKGLNFVYFPEDIKNFISH